MRCFAITAPGLESITEAELRSLGLEVQAREAGGLEFEADATGLYRANLQLRTASRVLVRLASFRASTFFELERRARKVPWAEVLAPGTAVRFRVTSRKSRLYHQDAIAERLASAAQAPAGGDEAPVQEFVARVWRDEVTISADSSGALLHQRGYRLDVRKAPLRETLAAAMLLASRWQGTVPLVDPLCGSGTIPIEAALMARRIPPGWHRDFAFAGWPGFETTTWNAVRAQLEERMLPKSPVPILAFDRDAGAVRAAQANAHRAGVAEDVAVGHQALSHLRRDLPGGAVITNPPYGHRVGDHSTLRNLYGRLGGMIGEGLGWSLTALVADEHLARAFALPVVPLFSTTNGGLRVRCVTSVT